MKNRILKWLTIINFISALMMACAVDSESLIPVIVLAVNVSYLFLFTIANMTGGKYGTL